MPIRDRMNHLQEWIRANMSSNLTVATIVEGDHRLVTVRIPLGQQPDPLE